MPASKTPSRNRVPQALAKECTNAVARDMMPKHNVMAGRNQPGPKYLQAIFEGISNTMYDMKNMDRIVLNPFGPRSRSFSSPARRALPMSFLAMNCAIASPRQHTNVRSVDVAEEV